MAGGLKTAVIALAALAVAGGGAFLALTAPQRLDDAEITGLSGDAERGAQVFAIGGCASCHSAPGAEAEAEGPPVLAGGARFVTPFGTFYAPNISPGPQGIGGWSVADLANAMMRGVSPGGAHYYPAFPYTSYARMELQDIADLKAWMDTLRRQTRRIRRMSFPSRSISAAGLASGSFYSLMTSR